MKDMNRQMNDEDISILNSLIAQYIEISQKENVIALKCIVEKLNNAWEDARRNLYKESV